MPRGYWRVFAAIAGLILVGASEPPKQASYSKQGEAKAEQSKPAFKVAAPSAQAPKPIQSTEQAQPCGQGRYASSDDLCAQWKAADAASDAAQWAWWQIILSALGVIGLGITLWFNFRALRLAEREANETKDALAIAEMNAKAAVRMADLAERTSSRQLRAYVYVKSVRLEEGFAEDSNSINCVITISNSGQTPAYVRKIAFLLKWITEDGHTTVLDTEAPTIFRVHKDVPTVVPYEFQVGFDKADLRGHMLIAGRIEYKDAFGKVYKEPFSWRTLEHDFVPFDNIDLPANLAYFAIESIMKPDDRPRPGSEG